MNIEDYARELRKLLGVSDAVTTDAILDLIKKEGWEPHLFSEEVEGHTLWACPIRKGIFRTLDRDEATGQTGQAGSPTAEIAALEGFRKARFEPRLQEIWEFISSADISEDEVRETAEQLSSVDGRMSLVIKGGPDESHNLRSRLSRIIEEWKPKTPEQRLGYLHLILAFLTFLSATGLSNCRSKQSTTIINNFWNFNITSEDKP